MIGGGGLWRRGRKMLTFLGPDQSTVDSTGGSNRKLWSFFFDPPLQKKIQSFTHHLAGKHENNLDISRRPYQCVFQTHWY